MPSIRVSHIFQEKAIETKMLWLSNNGNILIILFAPSQRHTKYNKWRILLSDLYNVLLLHVYLCICLGQCHWPTGEQARIQS